MLACSRMTIVYPKIGLQNRVPIKSEARSQLVEVRRTFNTSPIGSFLQTVCSLDKKSDHEKESQIVKKDSMISKETKILEGFVNAVNQEMDKWCRNVKEIGKNKSECDNGKERPPLKEPCCMPQPYICPSPCAEDMDDIEIAAHIRGNGHKDPCAKVRDPSIKHIKMHIRKSKILQNCEKKQEKPSISKECKPN